MKKEKSISGKRLCAYALATVLGISLAAGDIGTLTVEADYGLLLYDVPNLQRDSALDAGY